MQPPIAILCQANRIHSLPPNFLKVNFIYFFSFCPATLSVAPNITPYVRMIPRFVVLTEVDWDETWRSCGVAGI